jgi:hypothetical protein
MSFFPGKIHNPFHFVRDFYFFKRSQYPQLALVHKKPAEAYLELQEQAFRLGCPSKLVSIRNNPKFRCFD